MIKRFILSISLFSSISAFADDLVLNALYVQPSSKDAVTDGLGAEVQWIWDGKEGMGLALAVGGIVHGANDSAYILSSDAGSSGVQLAGDVRVLPLGASILFRAGTEEGLTTSLELGARYLLVDSGLDAARVIPGSKTEMGTLDMEDGAVALARVGFSAPLTPNLSVLAGLGYQIDLLKGDVTFKGTKVSEAQWEALLVSAGLCFHW